MYKRLVLLLLLFLTFLRPLPLKAAPTGQETLTDAGAVIVLDNSTGKILYAKNADLKLPPASLTKLMTAYITVQKGHLSDTVTVGPEVIGVDGTTIGLQPGDKISIENLLYAVLMHSSNEAANVLAVYTAGSVQNFVTQMNAAARSMGLFATNFVNPNGLPASNHYSTAADLAKIAFKVLQFSTIKSMVATKEHEITWQRANGNFVCQTLENTNKLLDIYPGVAGIKTGTTVEAGQCLVTYAQWYTGKVIVVVLRSSNRYRDTAFYLDQAYKNLQLKRSGQILTRDKGFRF